MARRNPGRRLRRVRLGRIGHRRGIRRGVPGRGPARCAPAAATVRPRRTLRVRATSTGGLLGAVCGNPSAGGVFEYAPLEGGPLVGRCEVRAPSCLDGGGGAHEKTRNGGGTHEGRTQTVTLEGSRTDDMHMCEVSPEAQTSCDTCGRNDATLVGHHELQTVPRGVA